MTTLVGFFICNTLFASLSGDTIRKNNLLVEEKIVLSLSSKENKNEKCKAAYPENVCVNLKYCGRAGY